MTTMVSQDFKMAVVQFGNLEDKEIKQIAKELKGQVDWYIFEEDADYNFEIKNLYENYDAIFECLNKDNFEEIK